MTDELALIEDPLQRVMLATNSQKLPEDSCGWFVDYFCRLVLSGSPQFTERYVLDELSMIVGWIHYGWLIENDPMNRFGGLKRISRGYVYAERDALIEEAHIAYGWVSKS